MTDCDARLAAIVGLFVGVVTAALMPRLYRWRWGRDK